MRIIGKPLSYTRKILKNSKTKVNLTVTDGLGTKFRAEQQFHSDQSGLLNIDSNTFRDFISKAKADRPSSFLIPEFENYKIKLESDKFEEEIWGRLCSCCWK